MKLKNKRRPQVRPACLITLHQQTKAVGGGLEPPTVQLATVQIWWSTPVAPKGGIMLRLSLITTPETGGHVCQFRHPTV